MRNRLTVDAEACKECGFELWEPIAQSQHSKFGLYNDDRFPGRGIVALRQHFESLAEVPMDTVMGFMRDIQVCMLSIKSATNAHKVNVAILGNRDSHVHAHLIPRYPDRERYPDCSPWNDPRQKGLLQPEEVGRLKTSIYEGLKKYDSRKAADAPSSVDTDKLVLFDL